ncbi:Peroxin-14 [Kluyveromyces marxianus]
MTENVSEDRKELYDSAIAFLRDPNVASAPLAKKIEFLEGKGLTQDEIEKAIKEASSSSVTETETSSKSQTEASSNGSTGRPSSTVYEAVPPAIPNRDWRDYFIMATASAGLFYGVYQITKRYILPQILPESKSKLEQDKELIMEQFDKVEKLLSQIEQEHEEYKQKEEAKLDDVDRTILQLQNTLDETAMLKQRMEAEFTAIKKEFNNMQSSIDTFVRSAGNDQELKKLQDEIQSLKNLIKSSLGTTGGPGGPGVPGSLSQTVSPNSTGFIPGADSIPSAADILANMELGKTKAKSKSPEAPGPEPASAAQVPAWKKAREENMSKSSVASNSAIPEWQRAMNTGNSYESN